MWSQIQIQFLMPGQWDKFTLIAVYRDADGYTPPACFTQDDIPADQAPALAAVVGTLVSMGEPWQASQVWARRAWVSTGPEGDADIYQVSDAVILTVEAVNPQGGRRTFTVADYPEFVITDPGAVAFFKYFTKQNHE